MKSFFVQKKALGIAILEDVIFLLFLLTLLTSGLEILLPGSVSAKLPLSLIFSLLALVLLLYIYAIQKDNRFFVPPWFLPKSWLILSGILLFILSFVLNSAFGVVASGIQIFLLILISYFLLKK